MGNSRISDRRELISPKLDVVFKILFIRYQDLLYDFLSDILGIPRNNIGNITLSNTEIPPEAVGKKFSRLDLSMQVDNKLVNVEVQLQNHAGFQKRALFYWADLYLSELQSGENYDQLKQTISIHVLDFNLFDWKPYCTRVRAVAEAEGVWEHCFEEFSIHFLELKKVGKQLDADNRRALWMQFFNAASHEDFEKLKATGVSAMERAVQAIYDLDRDPKVRAMVRDRERALHEEASLLTTAKAEGMVEGMAKGKAEERAGMISGMRAIGMSEQDIQKVLDNIPTSQQSEYSSI